MADAVMTGQILWRARRSPSRQIGRTRADYSARRADPYRDQAAVRQRANTQSDIDLLLKQAQYAIGEDQIGLDVRIGLQEIRQDRNEVSAPKADRGRHRQLAG